MAGAGRGAGAKADGDVCDASATGGTALEVVAVPKAEKLGMFGTTVGDGVATTL